MVSEAEQVEGSQDGLDWIKSSLSFSNGNCVEVASPNSTEVAVRNSTDPEGPVLRFPRREIRAWIEGAKLGEFDHFGDQ